MKARACIFSLIGVLFLSALPVAGAISPTEFRPGQKWAYQTRPEEKDSWLLVLRVEPYSDFQRVIHVAVFNLKMKNPRDPEHRLTNIPDLPMEEDALRRSVTEMTGETWKLPEYAREYEAWKKDRRIFESSVAAAVESLERAAAGKASGETGRFKHDRK